MLYNVFLSIGGMDPELLGLFLQTMQEEMVPHFFAIYNSYNAIIKCVISSYSSYGN